MAGKRPKSRSEQEHEATEAHVAAAEAAVEAEKAPGFCHSGADDEIDKAVAAASARLGQLSAALGGPGRHPETGRFTAAGAGHPITTEGRAADSPANPSATPRAATPWPAASAPLARAITSHGVPRAQVGQPAAPTPAPAVTLHTFQGADHPHTSYSAPATAVVQSIDLRGGAPASSTSFAPRMPFGTSPIGATPPQPRGPGATGALGGGH